MILTNTVSMLAQVEQSKAQRNFHSALKRISSGLRIDSSSVDSGSMSQSMRLGSQNILDNSFKVNLQNTRSYLTTQEEGLQKALKIYDRIETLCLKAMDITANDQDRKSYNDEFKSLVENLDQLMSTQYQGRRLFNATLLCGGVKKYRSLVNWT